MESFVSKSNRTLTLAPSWSARLKEALRHSYGTFIRLPFWLVAGLWAVTYFITLVPVSVNGLGVQELSVTFLFSSVGGVSPAAGLTLALFMRLLPILASLPGALFLPGILAGDDPNLAAAWRDLAEMRTACLQALGMRP